MNSTLKPILTKVSRICEYLQLQGGFCDSETDMCEACLESYISSMETRNDNIKSELDVTP